MPPKKAATEGEGLALTENDVRVLSLAWQCFETMPKVNLPFFSLCSSKRTKLTDFRSA